MKVVAARLGLKVMETRRAKARPFRYPEREGRVNSETTANQRVGEFQGRNRIYGRYGDRFVRKREEISQTESRSKTFNLSQNVADKRLKAKTPGGTLSAFSVNLAASGIPLLVESSPEGTLFVTMRACF